MSSRDDGVVLEKNVKAAGMWSSGGRAYDEVSRGVEEGIRHCVLRLAPQKDERILDIATGTGLTARNIGRSGAKVTGVDIAQGLLDAAQEISEEEGLLIDWQIGDAEKLPFADSSFDAAASTFGIMFASNQDAAISELARVVRPGGRIDTNMKAPFIHVRAIVCHLHHSTDYGASLCCLSLYPSTQ